MLITKEDLAMKKKLIDRIVYVAIGVAGTLTAAGIKHLFKRRESRKAVEDHKRQTLFDNQQELETYMRKLKMRKEFEGPPSKTDSTVVEELVPLKPKVYNPFDSVEPVDKMRLFGPGIHIGDCGVIGAPKGVGKTTLLMQISNAIAEGKPTGLWPEFDEGFHTPQRVLYYDGELLMDDMYNRYYKWCFDFHDNFERYDKTQIHSIDDVLRDIALKEPTFTDNTTIVIDNATKLADTSDVSEVNRINQTLDDIHSRALSRGIKLTIIIVLHVLGKEYREGKPIQLKDMAGASNLTNFCNFVIGLEKPLGKTGPLAVRVINCRGEREPDSMCLLNPADDKTAWAHFEYAGIMSTDGTRTQSKEGKDLQEAQNIQTYLAQGHTKVEAAAHFGLSRPTIDARLKLLDP